jgi:hypothetical protein
MKDNHLEVSGKTCCPTCGQTLPKPEPSVEILEELFDYNSLTGFVTNKYRPRKYFNTKNSYSTFNSYQVGKRSGSEKDRFRRITLFGKPYPEHRLIWALYYKEWPPKEMVIDHINGDPFDNKIDNLRLVTHRENAMNRRLSCNNKSGVIGVHYYASREQWQAQITVKGKKINLGRFDNFDDAVKSRKDAEIKYGFHENHGRDGIING